MDYADRAVSLPARLRAPLGTGSVSHAYIFTGSGGMVAAKEFAKAVFCRSEGERPCGSCTSCVKAEHDNHEDLIYLRRKGNSIGVKQVEELQLRLRNKPYASERVITIIEDADRLTVPSQNKLLKTLEEPNPSNIIILLARNPERLLKTIQSRCALARLRPGAIQEDAAAREAAAALADGLDRGAFYCELTKLLDGAVSDKDSGLALLDALELKFRGLMLAGAGIGRETDSPVGDHDFAAFIDAVEEARRGLDEGLSHKYTLRAMLLDIRG